ncbi:kinetochore protein SLK19-like [Melanotaenia boesemani]|uniref:kinetochore protein SLK19-like n=1 Tax=Melanotaenia boesemani TaxID=1250792 RepID=UPI001C0591A4|nr:kinetochore protein SLK19-like [Melanotaenia boesemani]
MFRKLFKCNCQESGEGEREAALQQENQKFKTQNVELRYINEELRKELTYSRRKEARNRTLRIDQLYVVREELMAEVHDLKKSKETLQTEINQQNQLYTEALKRLEEMEHEKKTLVRSQKLNEIDLKLEIDHLLRVNKLQTADIDALKISNDVLFTEINQQKQWYTETQKRLGEMENDKKILERKGKVEREILESKIAQLTKNLQIQETQKNLLRDELCETVDALKQKTRETLNLQKDLDQAKLSLVKAEQEKSNGDEILSKNLELREQVTKLQNDLEEWKTKCASLEQKTSFFDEKDQKLSEHKAGLDEDGQAPVFNEDAFNLMKSKIRFLEQQNKEFKEENLKQQNDLEKQKILDSSSDSHSDKTEMLHLQNQEIKKENEQLKQDLKRSQLSKSKFIKNEFLQKQNEGLNEQNNKLREELEKLKHFKLKCNEETNKVNLLQKQTEDLKEENEKLQEPLETTCDAM